MQVAAGLVGEDSADDAVWLVELAAVTDGVDVLPEVAAALGVASTSTAGAGQAAWSTGC